MSVQFFVYKYSSNKYSQSAIAPIPLSAPSEAWFCGHLLAGIAGSSFAEGIMYLSLISVVPPEGIPTLT
jgi:hypothetical protein